MVRKKHVPQRTCVVCRQVMPKRDLIRVVRTPLNTVLLDETGKAQGRGAYLCSTEACRKDEQRSKHSIGRALKVSISDEDWVLLGESLANLPKPK